MTRQVSTEKASPICKLLVTGQLLKRALAKTSHRRVTANISCHFELDAASNTRLPATPRNSMQVSTQRAACLAVEVHDAQLHSTAQKPSCCWCLQVGNACADATRGCGPPRCCSAFAVPDSVWSVEILGYERTCGEAALLYKVAFTVASIASEVRCACEAESKATGLRVGAL